MNIATGIIDLISRFELNNNNGDFLFRLRMCVFA